MTQSTTQTKRCHSIRLDTGSGNIIAHYRDQENAHAGISAEEARADFIGTANRTIARLERDLADWRKAKGLAEALTETDFKPAAI